MKNIALTIGSVWYCISLFMVSACVRQDEFQGVTIDVPFSEIQDSFSLTEICQGMEIIPLEANEESLLTPVAMGHYRVFGDTIYVLDLMTHAVQIFKLTGEHLYTLKRYGRGPGEYMLEKEIFINPYTETLDLVTAKGEIVSYDIKNNYRHVKTITISDEVRSVSECVLHPSGKGYFFFSRYDSRQLGYLDFSSGEARFFDYELDQDLARSEVFSSISPFSTFGEQVFFLEPFSGKVFRLDENSMAMHPHVWFNAGRYSYIIGKENQEGRKTAAPYMRFLEKERYLFAEVVFDKKCRAIIYDKQEGICRCFHKTAEDLIWMLGEFKDGDMFILMDPSIQSQFTGKDESLDKGNALLLKYSINPVFR